MTSLGIVGIKKSKISSFSPDSSGNPPVFFREIATNSGTNADKNALIFLLQNQLIEHPFLNEK
jgi:hypothetical protein